MATSSQVMMGETKSFLHRISAIWDRWARGPERRLLLILFVMALLVRIIYCLAEPNPYQGAIAKENISDAIEYDIIARTLAAGGGFGFYPGEPTAFRYPLLPFLAAGIYLFTGPHPVAVQIMMMVLGALIAPVLFLLARRFVEPAAALLAGVMAVFYPSLVIFSVSFMTETPFTLLALLTLLCWNQFSTITQGGWRYIVAGGLFMGLGFLVRVNILPLFGYWLLYLLIAGGRERWRHIARYLVFCAIAIAVTIPWHIRNYLVFGEWTEIATNGGINLWSRYNLLPPDGTIDSRQDIQQELHRIYHECKVRIDAGEDPAEVTRPYLAQTVRGYLLRLGPDQQEYVRSFSGLNESQVDKRLFSEGLLAMVQFPMRTAIKIVKNTIKFWDPYRDPDLIHKNRSYNFSYGILAPFWFWGIVLSWKQWRRFMLLYLTILAFWSVSAVLLLVERYRIPVACIGFIFASGAVMTLVRRPGKPWFAIGIIGGIIVLNIIIMAFGGPILQNIREAFHAIR
jgi:4-amino-4-deoxy-L-arabinose transferase-like glycosyltransferase